MQNVSAEHGVIEIDLVQILRPLASRWLSILVAVALGAATGFGVSMVEQKRYASTVTLAIVKTRTDVQFDQRIRTSQPEDVSAQLAEFRRNSLVGLADAPSIGRMVMQSFGDRFEPNTTLNDLNIDVTVESAVKSDLIKIQIWADEPKLSAEVATLWGREYEKLANSVLSGVTPEYVAQVDAELVRSKSELTAAQDNLVQFMREAKMDDLRLTINQKVRELDRLEALRLSPVLGALQRKQSSLGAVASLGEAQERTRQLLTLAQSMRKQVELGGEAAASSNVIPLLNLKLQSFAIVSARSAPQAALDMTTSSVDRSRVNDQRVGVDQTALGTIYGTNLQLNLPPDMMVNANAEMQLRDLDSLITTLSEMDQMYSVSITQVQSTAENTAPPAPPNAADVDAAILRTSQELREARAGLEEATFRMSQLTAARDVLRDSTQSLRAKRAEVDVSTGVGNSQVRLAGAAVESQTPVSRQPNRILVGVGGGLLLGLLFAIATAMRAGDFKRRPDAESSPA